MTLRWAWTTASTGRVVEHSVELSGDAVTERDGAAQPAEKRRTLEEVFARPHLVCTSAPRVRRELVAAVAERLSPARLARPSERARLAFWRAYDPARVREERIVYVVERPGRDPSARTATLDPDGLHVPEHEGSWGAHALPDDVFVHGAPLCDMPLALRDALRARLLDALRPGHGLSLTDACPRMDHRRIARRSWSWGERADGESGLTTQPGSVTVGYQYGHDMGWTDHAPERVLTAAPDLYLGAPEAVEREAREALSAAVIPARAWVEHAPEAVASLRARAVDRAPWAHESLRTYDISTLHLPRLHAWGRRAALGLYASLRPEAELPPSPTSLDEWRHGHAYNWHDDAAWLADDGTGVLCAEYCFGGLPGDGVNEAFHVLPGGGRRVLFDVNTDSIQNRLEVRLSADEPAALAALCAHVDAWWRAFGLGAPVESPAPAWRRNVSPRSAP